MFTMSKIDREFGCNITAKRKPGKQKMLKSYIRHLNHAERQAAQREIRTELNIFYKPADQSQQ